MRGKTVEVKCPCGTVFTARVADRKRGWAKSCSKSCAATRTNQKTGNFQRYCAGKIYNESEGFSGHNFSNEEHDCNKD